LAYSLADNIRQKFGIWFGDDGQTFGGFGQMS